jgi:hypothetical protein
MQVIGRKPLAISTQSQYRHFIAKVPNGVNRPGHTNEMLATGTIFDAVLIGDD